MTIIYQWVSLQKGEKKVTENAIYFILSNKLSFLMGCFTGIPAVKKSVERENERSTLGENAQLKLFWGRMDVLRQWLAGSIFTPEFQKQEVLISLWVSFQMSPI